MNTAEALIGISLFVTIAVFIKSVTTIYLKRMELRQAAVPAIERRLEHIESAVDVIAVEVERIAEAQRFAARLSAGGEPTALSVPGRSPEGRTVTPH